MVQHRREALFAAVAYTLLAIVMTWPLVRGLGRDVAGDLGDPLLNMWIVSWDAEQLRAIGSGDLGRARMFFDANIFHPSPLTLAYSEHLVAQAVQSLPIYLATKNPILVYNLLLLSTFVLSGLGCFLFVRALTGHTPAAFFAGVLYAFAPYRFSQAAHLQVLSAQWMPFALYGFRRYFETGRRWPLAGAAAALVLQNLSCGYFMLYFAPIALGYVVWEIAARSLWRNRRMWLELSAAAVLVLVVTLPFVLPYKQLRDSLQLSRDVSEVIRYSADVYSYFTAFESSRMWGRVMREFPKPEGDLFPGLIPIALAAIAVAAALPYRDPQSAGRNPRNRARALAILFAIIAIAYALLAVMAIFSRRVDLDLVVMSIRARDITRLLVIALVACAAVLFASPPTRVRAAAFARRPEAIVLALLVLAWWLSLGPVPRVYGRALNLWSPYRMLYDFVPGFEGVRVPARFGMIVALLLAVLAGLGAARFGRSRAATIVIAACAALSLLEGRVAPFPVNGNAASRDYVTPEPRVYRPARAPAIYQALTNTPRDVVVLELPLGESEYDVRAVYYSTVHWRRLVNGYSGFFPPHYSRLIAILAAAARGDDVAWPVLQELGVTHVVIHEGAYRDDEGVRLGAWLRQHGATEIFRDGSDSLLAIPQP